jgi:NAD(P)H-nitrite reductase large subunit
MARHLIIGNGIAGTTCAETLRTEDPDSQVTLVGLEPYPLYNRVSLPRYLKGLPRERVLLRTVEQHRERGIDLRLERVATGVDTAGKTVKFDDGSELPYDKLMLCTGGRPLPYPAEGAESVKDLLYAFQTLDETDAIVQKMKDSKAALVVGGSFIAYELAEGFIHNNMEVFWVQRGPRFLRRVLDEAGGEMVDFLAKEAGVQCLYNEEVHSVAPAGGRMGVKLKGGRELTVDMLGYGLGLKMYSEWLEGSGIKVDGGIVVNEYLETSVPDVYAGGDIAKFVDLLLDGQYNQMGTWDNAEEHGRTAALNMLGRHVPYREVPTYSTSMFKSNLAVMGITPENAEVESVTRLDIPGRFYRALFFYKGRIAGCVMIGNPKGRKKLIEMMQQGLEVAPGDRERLLDPANLA